MVSELVEASDGMDLPRSTCIIPTQVVKIPCLCMKSSLYTCQVPKCALFHEGFMSLDVAEVFSTKKKKR